MNKKTSQISCIILAGGEGKRVSGLDKGLLPYKNKPLIAHVFNSIKPQVDDIVISANRNTATYKQYTTKVINDLYDNYRGPLAGIAASLPHCKHELILVVACDMPALPADLVKRLATGIQNQSICIATVNKHHQLAMIVKKDLLESIQQQLNNNRLKLIHWVKSVAYNTVSFDDTADAFSNLNKLN